MSCLSLCFINNDRIPGLNYYGLRITIIHKINIIKRIKKDPHISAGRFVLFLVFVIFAFDKSDRFCRFLDNILKSAVFIEANTFKIFYLVAA